MTKTDERREKRKKWEVWRVALKEMKSDLLVQRVLHLLCCLGNGFVLLILRVCVQYFWECGHVCVYLLKCICFLVSFCVCLWYQDLANQCCLGLAVSEIHLDLALIISVVIFTKWFRVTVWCVAWVCLWQLCWCVSFLFFLFLMNEIPINCVWTKEKPKTEFDGKCERMQQENFIRIR